MATLEEMLWDAGVFGRPWTVGDGNDPAACLHRCPGHVRVLIEEVGRLAARNAELERGLDLSSGRFSALNRASSDAWRRLADDLENPSLQARAEALQWARDAMLGAAAGPGAAGETKEQA